MKTKLNIVATALKVHPRTVLRALTGVENTYWVRDHDPNVDTVEVAIAFGLEHVYVQRALKRSDALLTPKLAAEFLEMSPRTLRHYKNLYIPVLKYGRIVRYSQRDLANTLHSQP